MQIQNEVLHACLLQLGDCLVELAHRGLGKPVDFDVANARCHHEGSVHRVNGDFVSDDFERQELGVVSALDANGNERSLWPFEQSLHVLVGHTGSGYDIAVDRDNAVARHDPEFFRGSA